MEFKDILKDLRLEMGLQQKEVAKHCDVSPQCISQLELGTRNPTGSTLVALANFFNCSIDYLMGRNEQDSIYPPVLISHKKKKEMEIVSIYNSLPIDLQQRVLQYTKKVSEIYQEELHIDKK